MRKKKKKDIRCRGEMSHQDLVKMARRWLRTQGCGVIITEMTSGAGQEPDAIGWHTGYSTLIECKASRRDFLNDKNKCHQRIEKSMGDRRYYMAPPGIIKKEELTDGWGLLQPCGKRIKTMRSARRIRKEKNIAGEITLLLSAIRRIRGIMPKGTSVKAYTMQTECRATIGIKEEEVRKK